MKIFKHWRNRIFFSILLSGAIVLQLNAKDIYQGISKSIRLYSGVYKNIITNYVDEIEAEKLAESAVRSMVRELDPYTIFLSKDEREPLDMMTKGEYGGVGLRITMKKDTLTVISPMDGTPAVKAGIFPGDQILKVDSIFIKDIGLDKAAKLIRGKIGTKVTLTIRRPGIHGESIYTLQRAKIDIRDVSFSGIIEEGVGYIRLSGFSKGAAEELRQALSRLSYETDMKSLIVDLRGNPGGLLDEALKIVDLFIDRGDTILYTRGRTPKSNRIFVAKLKPMLSPDVKIAVLVDRGSASASEIVSGVLQDLDRGIVLGSSTFGKGLVQTIFQIDKNYSIKITTAKYYIPSGRLIQKSDYIANPDLVESSFSGDSVFFSRNGRRLKGGGGIIPDVEVLAASPPFYVRELWRQGMFYTFAIKHKREHPEVSEPIIITDEILEEFHTFLDNSGFEYMLKNEKELKKIEEELLTDERFEHFRKVFDDVYSEFDSIKAMEFNECKDFVERGISSELATLVGGLEGRVKDGLKNDPVIEEAINILADNIAYDSTLGFSSR